MREHPYIQKLINFEQKVIDMLYQAQTIFIKFYSEFQRKAILCTLLQYIFLCVN